MRKTFSLLALSLGVLLLCTAAYAQGLTVTFTLTCDKQASATLTPVAGEPGEPVGYTATIHVADSAANLFDCGITSMQCDSAKGGEKSVTATCSGFTFTPVAFITSFHSDVQALTVTNKHGSGSCIVDGAVPSSNGCPGPGGGGRGATLSASSPQ